jgi:uncharacterized phage infection (PIP) family protein YhgE
MTKRILEISLSVFVITCVLALIIGIFSLKPFYNSGLKLMEDSHEVLQNSKALIKELREGVAETKKTSTELVKMLQNSSVLFNEMTGAVEETKDTPKEFVKLLQEIRLLAGEIKNTVYEANKSQSELTQGGKVLIKDLREGIAETKKTSIELVKMLQNSSLLFEGMTGIIEETKDTPKELVSLLKEIRLLAGEIKDTVSEAQRSQNTLTQSANNARDILYEFAIASFILSLSEERIISTAEADQMILESIETIEGRSERFGKLAKGIIDYRKGKIKQ